MPSPVVLIGNDIHAPLNEMAAWQVERIRERFDLPRDQVVSLQSRKTILNQTSETILRGSPRLIDRVPQAARLFFHLFRLPPNRSRIIHWLGNGNRALRLSLIGFTKLTGRKLVWSPYGVLPGPWPKKSITVIAPHKRVLEKLSSPSTGAVIAPFAPRLPQLVDREWNGRVIFCSVPPKSSEFEERGVVSVIKAFNEIRESEPDVSLTIVNRYEWLHQPLQSLVRDSHAVTIRSGYVPDMLTYLGEFSALVIPYQKPHLAQVPQSVVEACAAGVPCIVRADLAFADELLRSGAGETFENAEQLLEALRRIRADFKGFRSRARELARTSFNEQTNLQALGKVYSRLAGIEFATKNS